MKKFFDEKTLSEIKKYESEPQVISNFLTKNECEEILKVKENLKTVLVNREESTKISFKFKDSQLFTDLKKKLEKVLGKFYVNDFDPHFTTSRFPLRCHVDTGKDPTDVIHKNIVLPLEINSLKSKKPNTIVFKNRWYYQSAFFTTKTSGNNDHIIKDMNDKFVDIIDIHKFKNFLSQNKKDQIVEYSEGKFKITDALLKNVDTLSKTKRYNLRTDEHIINKNNFDVNLYKKYMSHQPYEDLQSLEIFKALEWNVGDLIFWDRTLIHASDNFLKNDIESKTFIAIFSSKTNREV